MQFINCTETKKADPTESASALINLFPGSTPSAKASSVLLASSIAAWLISKEIYVLDGEVFEAACIFGAYYIWYNGAKEGAVEYFNGRQDVSMMERLGYFVRWMGRILSGRWENRKGMAYGYSNCH
jgi:F-type H+-transporting ATPase subunit b